MSLIYTIILSSVIQSLDGDLLLSTSLELRKENSGGPKPPFMSSPLFATHLLIWLETPQTVPKWYFSQNKLKGITCVPVLLAPSA